VHESYRDSANREIAELFGGADPAPAVFAATDMSFSYLFFSDVRKNVPDREKYRFARELVEFADQGGFEAAYFPERHFSEFGSIYASNAVIAAYFAPLTSRIRLRTAAVTATLHHPAAVVESWAMIDVLSDGRVDLGFGSGWAKPDFILSPDTYEGRDALRDERIPVIQKLWRGEVFSFPGPGGEVFDIRTFPRPVQPELAVWYVTTSDRGFAHAGRSGYNVFTMLSGIDIAELGKRIVLYRQARTDAGLDPSLGRVSLMLHTLVHPDSDWVATAVNEPFRDYIRKSVGPHLKAMGKSPSPEEVEKIVEYSFSRYFQVGGLFGPVDHCSQIIDQAAAAGVNEIAFLQDFGVDYGAVRQSLSHLEQLVALRRRSRPKPAGSTP